MNPFWRDTVYAPQSDENLTAKNTQQDQVGSLFQLFFLVETKIFRLKLFKTAGTLKYLLKITNICNLTTTGRNSTNL